MESGAATLRPVSLFYSYSHRDEEFRSALETHLSVLRRSRLIAEWHDRMIGAGGDWRGEIDRNLARADIVLLLVSADFLASDYCWSEEMAKALQRHERGEAHVIPVILRPCRWRSRPLARLQAVPRDGKPVTDWLSRDAAFDDVAAAIARIIEDQQQQRLQAAEEEERRRAEEAKRKAEEERKRREQKEAETRRKAEEEERRRAEAQRQAEQQAKRQAEGEKPKAVVSKWIVAAAVVLVVVLGAIFVKFVPERTTVPSDTAEKEKPVTSPPSPPHPDPLPRAGEGDPADVAGTPLPPAGEGGTRDSGGG